MKFALAALLLACPAAAATQRVPWSPAEVPAPGCLSAEEAATAKAGVPYDFDRESFILRLASSPWLADFKGMTVSTVAWSALASADLSPGPGDKCAARLSGYSVQVAVTFAVPKGVSKHGVRYLAPVQEAVLPLSDIIGAAKQARRPGNAVFARTADWVRAAEEDRRVGAFLKHFPLIEARVTSAGIDYASKGWTLSWSASRQGVSSYLLPPDIPGAAFPEFDKSLKLFDPLALLMGLRAHNAACRAYDGRTLHTAAIQGRFDEAARAWEGEFRFKPNPCAATQPFAMPEASAP